MPVNSFEDYPMSWKPRKSGPEKPYYLSIAAGLEADILSGKLPENTKLPPQRELADFLDLNLSTVTRAYKLCELKRFAMQNENKSSSVNPKLSAYFSEVVVTTFRLFKSENIDSLLTLVIPVMMARSMYGSVLNVALNNPPVNVF